MVMDTYEEKHFNDQRPPKRNWLTCEVVNSTAKKDVSIFLRGPNDYISKVTIFILTLIHRMGRKMQIDHKTTD